jgi:hypothetical protein
MVKALSMLGSDHENFSARPAIDKRVAATDQRGAPRTAAGPCDMGALEAMDAKLFLPLLMR